MLRITLPVIAVLLTACGGGGGGSSGSHTPPPPLPSTMVQITSATVSGDVDPALDQLRADGRVILRVDGSDVAIDASHHWQVSVPAATTTSVLLELLVDGGVVDSRLIEVTR